MKFNKLGMKFNESFSDDSDKKAILWRQFK